MPIKFNGVETFNTSYKNCATSGFNNSFNNIFQRRNLTWSFRLFYFFLFFRFWFFFSFSFLSTTFYRFYWFRFFLRFFILFFAVLNSVFIRIFDFFFLRILRSFLVNFLFSFFFFKIFDFLNYFFLNFLVKAFIRFAIILSLPEFKSFKVMSSPSLLTNSNSALFLVQITFIILPHFLNKFCKVFTFNYIIPFVNSKVNTFWIKKFQGNF